MADPELLRLFRLQLAVRGTGADIKTVSSWVHTLMQHGLCFQSASCTVVPMQDVARWCALSETRTITRSDQGGGGGRKLSFGHLCLLSFRRGVQTDRPPPYGAVLLFNNVKMLYLLPGKIIYSP